MKAVIYGAGNIGRGFIGQLMSQSGYEVVFLDIDKQVIELLNRDRSYPITVVSEDGNEEIIVQNVRAVDSSDSKAAAQEIASADVMATSVGVNVLRMIAPVVAAAVKTRIDKKAPPLNILLCENLIDADKYFKDQLFKYLDLETRQEFANSIGLVEASIGRMVPVFPKKQGDNPLRVFVEEFDILHLDKQGFCGQIPKIKNILPYSPFSFYMQRKLYIHNMTHAISAYLGAVKGHEYISEAIADAEIKHLTYMAGTTLVRAIAKDNACQLDNLFDFLYKLIYRFSNAELKDSVKRVAKDPLRKVHKNDRLVGAYRLCRSLGLDCTYVNAGIAALLAYKDKEDAASLSMQKQITQLGLTEAVKKLSDYDGFSQEDLQQITVFYGMLRAGSLAAVISHAQKAVAARITNI